MASACRRSKTSSARLHLLCVSALTAETKYLSASHPIDRFPDLASFLLACGTPSDDTSGTVAAWPISDGLLAFMGQSWQVRLSALLGTYYPSIRYNMSAAADVRMVQPICSASRKRKRNTLARRFVSLSATLMVSSRSRLSSSHQLLLGWHGR